MKPVPLIGTLIGLSLAPGWVARAADPKVERAFFEAKIRPILVAKCYPCHNAGTGKVKSGLALDTKQGVLKGGKRGPAIVPGQPDQSLLIKAIGYADPDLQMPPSGKLSAAEIADLTEWVRIGAFDPREESQISKERLTGLTDSARAHWAYQPVKKPAEPAVGQRSWVRTPIDAFILAKLEANGMTPNPPADKETLLRRATFDLIGMPPTTEELRDFLADTSPDAFARVVDRLLASKHYGERWGRHWLDTARYADTGGPQVRLDNPDYRLAFAWVYRDYVIEAFNRDKPYDQFILEQLAADQLPLSEDKSELAALGFLTVGERLGKPDDVINERIDAVGKAFLGLTVACARCHDHKFDPIPTADYYSLHGIFNSVVEPRVKPVIGKPSAQAADYHARAAALERRNRELYYEVVGSWGARFRQKAGSYMMYAIRFNNKKSGAFTAEDVRLRKEAVAKGGLDVTLLGEGRWMRAAKMPDDPVWGPLVRFSRLRPEEFADKAKALVAEIATKGTCNPRVAALFRGAASESLDEVEARYNKLFADLEPQAQRYLGARAGDKQDDLSAYDPALVQLIEVPFSIAAPAQLTFDQLPEHTREWPLRLRGQTKFTYIAKNELDLTHPGAPKRAMVLEDAPRPKDSYIFLRGDPREKGPVVPRRFLEVLSGKVRPIFKQGSGRLELARAIASKSNPLTARVAVNRVWMHHFGEGIVPTPDDLGVQSEEPSHPELIDWLAGYFMENGWSFKKLHRVIMLSSAYQQSSRDNPRYAQRDPGNRLLWRANLRRLEFEAIRDSLLVFSGNLDAAVGGQPVNLADEPYSFRRSVYGYVDRGRLPELMQQFDFSDPRLPTSKRATTVVPQQALFLMNSPMVVDVARKIVARKEVASAPDDAGRIAALYKIIFQRQPRAEEVEIGLAFLKTSNQQPSSGARREANNAPPTKARKGDPYGRAPIQNKGTVVERRPLTTWEQYAQALLFANEVVFAQ